jgi:hydrogenase maturation protease
VGNLLLKDEGVGVHVARELENIPSPVNIELEIIDGGTSSDLEVGEVDKLIIVDAAMMGGRVGDVYRLCPEDVNFSSHPHAHEVSLLYELELKRILKLPHPRKVIIFGIEPQEIGWGLELSEELKQKIPQILSLVREELEKT